MNIKPLIRATGLLGLWLAWSNIAFAVPTGSISQPADNRTYTSNLVLFFNVSDSAAPLTSAGLTFGNGTVQTFCNGNCSARYRGFRTGVNPLSVGLVPGQNSVRLWANSPNNILDTVTFTWQPRQITGVQATRTDSGVNLSWSALTGALRYNVYLASETGVNPSNFASLANGQALRAIRGTSQTITLNDSDTDYFVRITGVDASGESSISNEILIPRLANNAPVAQNDNYALPEDTLLNVNAAQGFLANDTDPDANDTLSLLSIAQQPSNGTLVANANGAFSYQPNANFFGSDRFVYVVQDNEGLTAQGQVTLVVTGVPDAPVTQNDEAVVTRNGVTELDVLANDTNLDGDNSLLTLISAQAQLGSVSIQQGRTLLYTPPSNALVNDLISYNVQVGTGAAARVSTGTVTVSVDTRTENLPPQANDDNYSVQEDTLLTVDASQGLLTNDTDPNLDDTLSLIAVVRPSTNGTVTTSANGGFSYQPNANFFGTDSFIYSVQDSRGLSAQAQVTLTVTAQPDAPIVVNESITADNTQATLIDVLANDTNLDGDNSQLVISAAQAQRGSAVILQGRTIQYSAPDNFEGTDTLVYTVRAGTAANLPSGTGTVTIRVNTLNAAPVANDDAITIQEDSNTLIDVLDNDTDPDGDRLNLVLASASRGEVNIAGNQLRYRPNQDYNGEDVILYQISDPLGLTAQAQVLVTIEPVNDAPNAEPDQASMLEDGTITLDVLANDSDPDGDLLTIVNLVGANGEAVITPDNLVRYTPDENFFGRVRLVYTLADAANVRRTTTVELTVESVNDAPVAIDDQASIAANQSIELAPLSNDIDVDSNNLTMTSATAGLGNVIITGSRTLLYSAPENFSGNDTVLYRVQDDEGASATGTIFIEITDAAPIATSDSYLLNSSNGAVIVDQSVGVLTNDRDPEGNTLIAALLSGPEHATHFDLNEDGSFTYTHDGSANLSDGFTYAVTDGTATTLATVTLTLYANNHLPKICTLPKTQARQGQTYRYALMTQDADEDTLSYQVTNLPAWLSFDDNTQTLSGTPGSTDTSAPDIRITVTDAKGGVDEQRFSIHIQPEFGSDGQVSVALGSGTDEVFATLVDNKGRTLLVGNNQGEIVVARLLNTGALDTSFAGTGTKVISVDNPRNAADIAIDAQNRIYVLAQVFDTSGSDSEILVSRLLEDGSLDTQFDTDGIRIVDWGSDTEDFPKKLFVHDSGLVTVVGHYRHLVTGLDAFAIQLQQDGTFNPNFGTSGRLSYSALGDQTVNDAVLDGENNLYLVGTHNLLSDDDFMVLQLKLDSDNDGILDGLFNSVLGDGGLFTYDVSANDAGMAIDISANGNLLIAGASNNQFWLGSFTPDFELDAAFASSGIATDDFFITATQEIASDIAQDQYGNIYLAGIAGTQLGIVKFAADGTLDSLFGTSGTKTFPIGSLITHPVSAHIDANGLPVFATHTSAGTVLLQQDNSLVDNSVWTCDLASSSRFSTPSTDTIVNVVEGANQSLFAIGYSRIHSEAAPDLVAYRVDQNDDSTAFGDNGLLRIEQDGAFKLVAAEATPDGSVMLLGIFDDATPRLLKLNTQGKLDDSFGNQGTLNLVANQSLLPFAMHVSSNGDILVAQTDLETLQVSLTKLSSDGSLITDFGNAGQVDYDGFSGKKLAIGKDGSIHVLGTEFNSGLSGILRFTADGQLDTNFGDSIPVQSNLPKPTPSPLKLPKLSSNSSGFLTFASGEARDMATLSDGHLLVLLDDSGARLQKFTSSGVNANGFGSNGKLDITGYHTTQYSSLTPLSSGGFIVQLQNSSGDFALINMQNNGLLNAQFMNAGKGSYPYSFSAPTVKGVMQTSAGKLVVFGELDENIYLSQLSSQGRPEEHATNLRVDFGMGEKNYGLALDRHARLLVAGSTHHDSLFTNDTALTRFDSSGAVDVTFGTSGTQTEAKVGDDVIKSVTVNRLSKASIQGTNDSAIFAGVLSTNLGTVDSAFNNGLLSTAFSANVETTHKMFRDDRGIAWIAGQKNGDAHVSQMIGNAGLNDAFSSTQVNSTLDGLTSSPETAELFSVVQTSDGEFVAVGYLTQNGEDDALVVKFDSQGNLDTQFANAGILIIGESDGANNRLYDVTLSADGNIAMVGTKDAAMHLLSYTNAGNLVAAKIVTHAPILVGKAIERDAFGGLWVAGHSKDGFELYRYQSDWTELYHYPARDLGIAIEAQDIVIDSLGNVFLTGNAQIEQEWDVFVLKYPQAAGWF